MLTVCTEPDCRTLVLGGKCVEHEPPQLNVFVRGRPFVSVGSVAVSSLRVRRHALLEIAHDTARGTPVVAVVGSGQKTASLVR